MDLELFEKIIPNESAVNYLSTKIEIKLKKAANLRWNSLEGTGETTTAKAAPAQTSSIFEYSSHF